MKKLSFTTVFCFLWISISLAGPPRKNLKVDDTTTQSPSKLLKKKFKNFSATTLDGEKVTLSQYKGKVILLNFWDIGCPPCMGEMGDINSLYKRFKDSNVVVLTLCRTDTAMVKFWLSGKMMAPKEKIVFPIIPNSTPIANIYQVKGVPATFLIDKKGRIRHVGSGSLASIREFFRLYGSSVKAPGWEDILEKEKDKPSVTMYDEYSEYIRELLAEGGSD